MGNDGDEDTEMGEFQVSFEVGNAIRQVQFVTNWAWCCYLLSCSIFILPTQLSFV